MAAAAFHADFLLGYPITGGVNGLPRLPYRFTQYMPYFGDTWKVSRNLTFNFGGSWFLATVPDPQKWARNLVHSFDPSTGLLTYAALGQIDPKILSFDGNNFAPRFGLAWSPPFLPRTVIRAGAGAYYADSALIEMQFGMVAPPFNTTLTINQPQTNPVPLYQLGKNVFPLLSFPPLDKTFAASLPVNTNAFLVNPDSRSPYINQWNLSIQRSISNNDLLELAYSDRADTSCRTATTPTSAASRQTCDLATKPWPRYSGLLTADFNGNSSYEALITKFQHRTTGGVNLRFECTVAKSLTDGWESGG